MLFNSLQFLLFFPIVTILYWVIPQKWRNKFLLIASYWFYMNWEPAYALLILFSTGVNWGAAMMIDRNKRRWILISALLLDFSTLFCFKYLNFAGDILRRLLDLAGIGMNVPEFDILLPVGISFFTFQGVGYLIDVWRGSIRAECNFITYALFTSFFPQLVAGPIERASNLLPQFHRAHRFSADSLMRGCEMMAMGYFMKLSIAENASPYVDAVYSNLDHLGGLTVIMAAFLFTIQIFCDFGGYSLIAIGAARCMGFRLMQNFRRPYLATSIRDFWRRWHVSLSTWFADYVYIPLGGNRVSRRRHYSNLILTFLASGLWHGANYTFIIWGGWHGALQCCETALRRHGIKIESAPRSAQTVMRIMATVLTFLLVMAGWVFFRAADMDQAFLIFRRMTEIKASLYFGEGKLFMAMLGGLILLLAGIEIWCERRGYGIGEETGASVKDGEQKEGVSPWRCGIVTGLLTILVLLTGRFDGGEFIYFQF